MSDERSLPELGRLLDDVRRDYLRKDVYWAERDADRARIKRLEDEDSTRETGTRTWLLGLVQVAFGAILAVLGAYLMARGHP